MVRKILFTVLVAFSVTVVRAQIKGTNTLGLGFNIQNYKTESGGEVDQDNSYKSFSVSYGNFIKENQQLGFSIFLNRNSYSSNGGSTERADKGYGGSINYQYYYPLLGKLFAFAGGTGGVNYTKTHYEGISYYNSNSYHLGANGGVSYFLSKRIALESNLLSAFASYQVRKDMTNTDNKSTTSSFNLSTSGAINNLGFKIYFLF